MDCACFALRRFPTIRVDNKVLGADGATRTRIKAVPAYANRRLIYLGTRPDLTNLAFCIEKAVAAF